MHLDVSQRTDTLFHTETSALAWEDGLIVGGGRAGAMLFGEAGDLTVSVSHERFFLPINPTPPAPRIAGRLEDLRGALAAGDSDRAGVLLKEAAAEAGFEDMVWTNPLGICSTLAIRSAAGGAAELRRTVDLVHGEVAASWLDAVAGTVSIRVIAPRDEDAVHLLIEAEREFHGELELGITAQDGTGLAPGARVRRDEVRTIATPGEAATLSVSAGHGDAELTAVTVVSGTGPWQGDGSHLRAKITVPARDRMRLVIALAVGADPETPSAVAVDAGEWSRLRDVQRRTHGELVLRSTLDLGGEQAADTMEELWRRARDLDAAARRRVVEIAYLAGRAGAISSTGELPPTLQGVWQGTWAPAWSADYTLNGNVQNGGMASLIPTGTPELARSLLRLVLPHLEDYRDNARNVFGAEGMLLPSRMSDNGRANHFAASFPHIFWTGCGGWVLRLVADIVSTTGDRAIVDDEVWALVEGVLAFAETAMVERDGVRHVTPGYSPENSPVPGGSPLVVDPTMDAAIWRDAARSARLLAEARGDHSLDERWQRIADAMSPYRIADDGTLAEWLDETWPENRAHRHTSQLYPLWYEIDEAFVGETHEARALRDAAARTIETKIAWRSEDPTPPPGRMEMAFGLVQLGLAAAALGDGSSALRCIEWLAIDHFTPALTTRHDAGEIFNLDASGGLPAVVAATLVGSDLKSLTVFPALPEEWTARGAVTGLTGRGGIIVESLAWEGGAATLRLSRRPEAAWLRPAAGLRLHAGSSFRFDDADDGELIVDLGSEPLELTLHRR